jgi:hypothetical protein
VLYAQDILVVGDVGYGLPISAGAVGAVVSGLVAARTVNASVDAECSSPQRSQHNSLWGGLVSPACGCSGSSTIGGEDVKGLEPHAAKAPPTACPTL